MRSKLHTGVVSQSPEPVAHDKSVKKMHNQMVVDDFCLKNTAFQRWLAFLRVLIRVVTMAAVFYNRTTLFYNRGETSSLSFAFTSLERSEGAQCYSPPRRKGLRSKSTFDWCSFSSPIRNEGVTCPPAHGLPTQLLPSTSFQRRRAFKIDLQACACFLCNSLVPDWWRVRIPINHRLPVSLV